MKWSIWILVWFLHFKSYLSVIVWYFPFFSLWILKPLQLASDIGRPLIWDWMFLHKKHKFYSVILNDNVNVAEIFCVWLDSSAVCVCVDDFFFFLPRCQNNVWYESSRSPWAPIGGHRPQVSDSQWWLHEDSLVRLLRSSMPRAAASASRCCPPPAAGGGCANVTKD